MFEYNNTHVFNVNMIVTMENIVAEENIIFIGHCLYRQDYHQLFLFSWILNSYNPCYTYFVQEKIM